MQAERVANVDQKDTSKKENKFSFRQKVTCILAAAALTVSVVTTVKMTTMMERINAKLEQINIILPNYLDEETYLKDPITIQRSIEEAKKDISKLEAGNNLVYYDFKILDDILKNKYSSVPSDLISRTENFYKRYEEFGKRKDKFVFQDLYDNSLSSQEMYSKAASLDRNGEAWSRLEQYRMENKAELLRLLQERITLEQRLLEVMPHDYMIKPKVLTKNL